MPNDGGQRDRLGSKVVAFETNEHYSYVAGDATGCYHPEKCRLALRQFVFVPPDHFVIFDRVNSTEPNYRKRWLLHTAGKPDLSRNTFSAEHEEGRLFCRTILPEDAELTAVGGPGEQFRSDGRNWPLPESFRVPDSHPLLGQWRIEVAPGEPRKDDLFLHLIQVGDRSLRTMVASEPVRTNKGIGLRFESEGLECQVLFDVDGPAGGHIVIERDGKTLIDHDLTEEVTPQAGLFGSM